MLKRTSTGFTLIEMMIALLVLSIGMLGIASLQARGQQFNHSAYVRTQAAFLAYDIMDRIRANTDNVIGNNNGDDGAYAVAAGSCPEASSNCHSASCTPEQIASYDLGAWCKALADNLPLGSGNITWDSDQRTYTINVLWTEDRSNDAAMKQQVWSLSL